MEITVNINADVLAESINNLAIAIRDSKILDSTKDSTIQAKTMIGSQKLDPKMVQEKAEENTIYKIEDIRSAFATFAKAKGKDKAKEILAKFSASKVTEIKERDYNQVMKVLEE